MDSPVEFSSRIKFSELTKWFEKIESATKNDQKVSKFENFLVSIKALQEKFYQKEGRQANGSLFPILRLFLPKLDTERDAYGLQMMSLGKLFVKVLAINPKSEDAKKLTLKSMSGPGLDYGSVVYDVMVDRSPKESSLTVYEVNKYLDLIADHFNQNERSKIDTEMVQLLQKLSATDRKWLTRIILKKLKFGLGEKRMMQLYHKNANNFFNQSFRLSETIKAIESGKSFDDNQTALIQLFKPIRPMNCERCSINQIDRMLEKHEYYLETKMDGERFHIHINGRKFRYFSRSCNEDFTSNFGADATSGNYSPLLCRLLEENVHVHVQTAILDGEMMVWDREDEAFQRKSEHLSPRFVSADDSIKRACFVIFDIIYFNGDCLTKKPYAERQRLLRSTFQEHKGVFMFCSQTKLRDAEHFLERLNTAFDANEEGVVIKQSSSFYSPGKREKGGWFKIKPEYSNNLVEDFDLLIIGANYNEMRTEIASFLLGVFKKNENAPDSGEFYAVCNIKNGFTREQFREIRDKLQQFWNKTDRTKRSVSGASCIEWNRAVPDFWIEPKHSLIIQVKGSELMRTHSHRTSHTIRFPRVVSIRNDKPWYEACTLDEFEKCCSAVSKTKRRVTSIDIDEKTAPRPPPAKRTKKDPVPQFIYSSNFCLDEIKSVDKICEGLNFCILSCDKKVNSIHELKKMVLLHGGRIVENPSSETYVCIAGEINLRVQNTIKSNKYKTNIASTKWLVRALGSEKPLKKLLPFRPKEMLFINDTLQEKFSYDFDAYGDSYTEPIASEEELIQFLTEMKTDNLPPLTTRELHDLEIELSNDKQPKNMFRLYTAFFYASDPTSIDKDCELSQFIFKAEAGNCLRTANEVKASASKLTHIFVRDKNFDRDELQRKLEIFGVEDLADVVVVRCQWILECYRANQKICARDYQIGRL